MLLQVLGFHLSLIFLDVYKSHIPCILICKKYYNFTFYTGKNFIIKLNTPWKYTQKQLLS